MDEAAIARIPEYERLNQEFCHFHPSGEEFQITESETTGAANIRIVPKYPCIHVENVDAHQIRILKEGKWCDHLVLSCNPTNGKWVLHIFELTKTMSWKKWNNKVLPQFNGGMLYASAAAGILQISEFTSIAAHCGYRTNADDAAPVKLRPRLGEPISRAAADNWMCSGIQLSDFPDLDVENAPIKLDQENGTVEYTL